MSEVENTTTPEQLDADAARAALREVRYPGLGRDLVSFGMVKHVSVCNGIAKVELVLRTNDPTIAPRITADVTTALTARGASQVNVVFSEPSPAARPAMKGTPDPWADQVRLAAVRHVIAVGAGKGGVGKSTVAVNLALALACDGLRVGLLDADIYGPSLPILLGIEDGSAHVRLSPEKEIIPLEAHGLPIISFGFFIGEGSPAIWRGPMVSKAVKQFTRGVRWPELDVLVVDLPPGTGDIPLSLAQSIALSGAVVVTQPQRLAGVEARKAADMFRELEVPVLGIVENMTGAFGRGGGARVSEMLGIPFLGAIPFDAAMVPEGDAGTPVVLARPWSDASVAFGAVSRAVAASLGWRHVDGEAEGEGEGDGASASGAPAGEARTP